MDRVVDLEVVGEQRSDAYAFTLKTPHTGRIYRVAPYRDPDQPRFWCVAVTRCAPGGLPDATAPTWIGPCGMRREDLKETLGAIRADPATWLATAARAGLRAWMLAPVGEPDR